jgi:hypothetical protein
VDRLRHRCSGRVRGAGASAGALAILCLILLSGCANLDIGSEYREDGSATHSVTLAFLRADLEAPAASTVARRLAEVEAQARDDGFEVARIDTANEVGLRIAHVSEDSEDAGAALNSLLNSISDVQVTGPFAPFQGTFNTQSGAVGGTAFTLELTVDGDALAGAIENVVADVGATTLPPGELQQSLRVSYVAIMPGEITDTDGVQTAESVVRWTLPLSGTTTITAESRVGKQGSTAWFVVAAVASFIGVIVVAAAVGYVLLRRHRSGRMRLPLPASDPLAGVSTGAAEQSASMSEVGSSLARVVERVVTGGQAEPDKDDVSSERE